MLGDYSIDDFDWGEKAAHVTVGDVHFLTFENKIPHFFSLVLTLESVLSVLCSREQCFWHSPSLSRALPKGAKYEKSQNKFCLLRVLLRNQAVFTSQEIYVYMHT